MEKKKNWFKRLFAKADKKMEEKSKDKCGCCECEDKK
jgi:hypothetical protein